MASLRQELEALRRILQALGARASPEVGPLLQLVNAAIAGRQVTIPSSLRNLLKQVRSSAGGSRSIGSSGRPPRQPEDEFRSWQPPEPGTPRNQPPGSVTRAPEEPRESRRGYQPQGYPEEQANFSDEFLSPTSSNVYSFQYYRRPKDRQGILYVTFKANNLKSTGLLVGGSRFRGGRKQLHGIPGKVHSVGKSNAPGPTYAYFSVPQALFTRMKQAYSKGKFVWDELRERGTVYGHKFRYSLVVGQIVNVPGAPFSQYIPRKATRRGFVTRSVADIGQGRRRFISSTLPPSSHGGGFTTRGR